MTITYESHGPSTAEIEAPVAKRPVWPAIRRGIRCRCPNCGTGKLFRGYLKVVPSCSNCGEDLSQHRADDLPPYLTIVIVGHIIVPLILFVDKRLPMSLTAQLMVWLPATLILALLLLPPTKGAVVGLQWALRMHGFDHNAKPNTYGEPEYEVDGQTVGSEVVPSR